MNQQAPPSRKGAASPPPRARLVAATHISIKRCDFLGSTNRHGMSSEGSVTASADYYVPIATCELQPVVILGQDHERFDDDELEFRVSNCRMHYRWRRGPARAVCFFHSYRCATIQCAVTLRCFCSYKCFVRAYKQLRRFYLSQGKIAIPRQQNEFTYGVPTVKVDHHALDQPREPDWEHYKLLKSAGLISQSHEEVWSTLAYNREYIPSHNDVGHQLKLDISVDILAGPQEPRRPHEEELIYWNRFDSQETHNADLTRIMMTSCVLPMVPPVERRNMLTLAPLDGTSMPQRVISPGTPLADALGIGLGFRGRGSKRTSEALREQIREHRIAFLTEHAFAEWGLAAAAAAAQPPRPIVARHNSNGDSFTVMTWNVLADIYASPEAYPCSESHVLSWTFRRERILSEIATYSPDVVCLQEIQGDHFEEFFAPALLRRGYEGLYKQKTTKLFRGSGKHKGGKYVCDGCATFFKVPKFHLLDHFGIEFARVMPPPPASHKVSRNDKRLLKDNVALVLCLEQLHADRRLDESSKRVLVIANTHILANPEAPDVKIWQANTLTSVLTEYMDKTTAFNQAPPGSSAPPGLVVCGDFNSTPASAVYDLVTKGSCDARHPELHSSDVCSWLQDVELGHGLELRSSYSVSAAARQDVQATSPNVACNYEPEFSNYTHEYVGCLDYIFFDPHAIRIQATLELVSELQLLKEAHALQQSDWALPSPQRPSDHLPLLARFDWNT